MNIMEYRIPLFIALIVLLIVVIVWKRREKQTNKSKKGGKKPKKKPAKSSTEEVDDDGADIDDSDEEPAKQAPKKSNDVAEDAKELYDVVHHELAGGMQIDDFEAAAGDLAGDEPSEVFIALKQKYTEAIDSNRDPAKSVTVKDYVEILKKSG